MKKFRLIRKYPGSPKLGFIINFGDHDCDYQHDPSNYLEFWEEVIEKDYEILKLISSENNPNHKKGSKILDNKDYKFKNMYPTEYWDIYSIKRLSDNEIFTLGDISEFGEIIGFLYDDKLNKIFSQTKNSERSCVLQFLIKNKQLLFITEDGVDIFESNIYYRVTNTSKVLFDKPSKYKASIMNQYINNKYPKEHITFSTKEKAEDYILLNKPVLSLNDVSNSWVIEDFKVDGTKTFNKLKELVKTKIK